MARHRAKRASRPNPREDRNIGNPTGYSNKKNQRKEANSILQAPIKPKKQRVEIIPRNLAQEDLVSSLQNPANHITFAIGSAGTGKTLLGTLHAIKALKEGIIEKIVITRPNISVDDRDIGFLPGSIIEKMSPWMMPILDVFAEYFTQPEIEAMLEEKVIEMVPLAYIRGRTFKQSLVLFDEAQNSTASSMLSVLTRLGEDSQMVVTGDLAQSDRGRDNGLLDFVERFERNPQPGISVVKFGVKDVERSDAVRQVLALYPDSDSL